MVNIRRASGQLALLMACVAAGSGCRSESPPNAADASAGSDGGDRCQTTIVGCHSINQGKVAVSLSCNETMRTSILGQPVCVTALDCDSNQCLTRAASCFPECVQDAAADAPEGGPVSSSGLLGARCASDSDCASGGLICVKPTDDLSPGDPALGGPPNGLCTTPCGEGINPDPCPALGGRCAVISIPNPAHPTGYCWESCTPGPGNPNKCHNRAEVPCNVSNLCVFGCTSDSECGTRKCNGHGCVDQLRDGGAFGSACTDNTQCASGPCVPFSAAGGFCSRLCRYGSMQTCGFRSTPIASGAGPVGGCVPIDPTTGVGDLSLCVQLCDVPGDCAIASEICVMDPSFVASFHHGYCDVLPDSGATPATDSGDALDGGSPPSTDAGPASDAP